MKRYMLKLGALLLIAALFFAGQLPAALAASPQVTSTTPVNGATDVPIDVGISADVFLPNPGQGVDGSTLEGNVFLCEGAVTSCPGSEIPAQLGTTGGRDAINLQPDAYLAKSTLHTFVITDGVKDQSGVSFEPFSMSFTTTDQDPPPPPAGVEFTKSVIATGVSYSSLAFGPDMRLYGVSLFGNITRWDVDPTDGSLSNEETLTTINGRALIGIDFQPGAMQNGEPVLWVSHNAQQGLFFGQGEHFTGSIARVSYNGSSWDVDDVVVGLPRSSKDHLTNSVAFGPDGALYFTQGSISAMGDRDSAWANQPETVLSAAALRLDLDLLPAEGEWPIDVSTGEPTPGGDLPDNKNYVLGSTELATLYDPQADGAPLTLYATGVRNAYDLVWHSNGYLYIPTNGSAAGGNTPAFPETRPEQCDYRIDGVYTGPEDIPAVTAQSKQYDFLYRIVEGGYYGHPNPTRCEWVQNVGNPSDSPDDPGEGIQPNKYPLGTMPDPNYRGYAFNFEQNKSPNGVIEYQSNVFGGQLRGTIMVVQYSNGNNIIVLEPGGLDQDIVDSTGNIPGFTGFDNPLDLTEDPRNGNIYLADLGAVSTDPSDDTFYLLEPNDPGLPEIVVTPETVSLSAEQGQTSLPAEVVVENNGTQPLDISLINIAGLASGDFDVSGPSVPLTVDPQESITLEVTFDASGTGVREAVLQISSNDPDNSTVEVDLYGLISESDEEPSLQLNFDALGLGLDVGDDNPSTPALHSDADTAQTSPLGPDEISATAFQKAGMGPVTVEPLAMWAPGVFFDEDGAGQLFPATIGWYPDGKPGDAAELFEVEQIQEPNNYKTLYPQVDGQTSFDPGTQIFGIYGDFPVLDARIHQAKQFDTYADGINRVRVYPYKLADGSVVPNQYLLAFEGANYGGGDYQDVILLVKNVKPAEGGRIQFENLDWEELNTTGFEGLEYLNTWLTFSGIRNSSGFEHDMVTLRIRNTHPSNTLVIDTLAISDETDFDLPNGEDDNLPLNIAPESFYDLEVQLIKDDGDPLGVYTETLTVGSSDPTQPTTEVTLAVGWMQNAGGNNELQLYHTAAAFGFTTNIEDQDGDGTPDGLPEGTWEASGEEVLSKYWVHPDKSIDVFVRQLASFHGSQTQRMDLRTTTGFDRFGAQHRDNDNQSLLPASRSEPDRPAGVIVGDIYPPFEAVMVGDVDIVACEVDCGALHGVRWWPVRDPEGTLVPGAFIVSMDYVVGGAGTNYDYNDNTYLVTSVQPEVTGSDVSVDVMPEGSASFGQPFNIFIDVDNNGLLPADNVELNVDITGDYTLDSVTPDAGTCNDTNPITCDFGSLAPDDQVEVLVRITPQGGTDFQIDAEVTTTTDEITTANNTDSETVVVAGVQLPSITILKEATPEGDQVFDFTFDDGTDVTPFTIVDDGSVTPAPIDEIAINFQNETAVTPSGYLSDFGQPFGDRGDYTYGWIDINDGTPEDLTNQGRDRGSSQPDQRLDTLIHMEHPTTPLPGFWEIELPNGLYEVEIAVGDPDVGSDPETHRVNAEGVNVINDYVPSGPVGSATRHTTATATVEVTDGRLTLDYTGGGDNTKLNYIIIRGVEIPGNQQVFADLQPGSYTINEVIPDGWSLADITCEQEGDPTVIKLVEGVQILLDYNQTVTCTFSNISGDIDFPPEALAGEDITVTDEDDSGAEDVTLNGLGSTDDDAIVSYEWTSNTGVDIPDVAQPTASFPVGMHEVTLTVTDSGDQTDTDTILVEVLPVGGDPCHPISLLGCSEVPVELDFRLDWDADEGGLTDNSDVGTGFTMVDPPSARLSADDPVFDANVPGYEPGLLSVDSGQLTVTSTKGIQYRDPSKSTETNSQINALGVGFDAGVPVTIETQIVNPAFDLSGGNNSQQAGLWFGLDEDNYVKLVVSKRDDTTGRVQLLVEDYITDPDVTPPGVNSDDINGITTATITLRMVLSPADGTATGFYSIDGGGFVEVGSLDVATHFFDGVNLPDDSDAASYAGIFTTQRRAAADQTIDFAFEYFSITDDSPNVAPVADAGLGILVTDNDDNGTEPVQLDGTASTDSDGTIVSYEWSATGVSIPDGEQPTADFPVGTTEVTLTVTDDDDATDTDTVSVTVEEPPNADPVADAGDDITVTDADENGSEPVQLDGSASTDSDGTIVSYEWSATGVSIPDGEQPTADFPVGTTEVTLTVTDDDGATDTDTVSVTVNTPANETPVADAGTDITATDADENGTEPVQLDGTGSTDSDGTIVSYEWSAAGVSIPDGAQPTADFPVGTTEVTLTVTDNDGATATDTVSVTVNTPDNVAPVAEAGDDITVTDGDDNGSEAVQLDGTGSTDSDGTIVSYEWSATGVTIPDGEQPTADFPVGTTEVTLTVTDDDGATDTDTVSVTVLSTGNNAPQTNGAIPNRFNVEGDAVTFAAGGFFIDPDDDALTYGASGLPTGLSIDPDTGTISGTVAADAAANSPYVVTLSASDAALSAEMVFVWLIDESPANNEPTRVSPIDDQQDSEGASVSLDVTGNFDDPDGDTLSYTVSGLPGDLSESGGVISGTIAAGAAVNSPYVVTVIAVDPSGGNAVDTFLWVVDDGTGGGTPQIDPIGEQVNNEGDVISLQVSASDPDGDTLTYAAEGLPAGLSIDASTGLISGTVASGAAGTYTVTIKVVDDGSPAANAETQFTWVINASGGETDLISNGSFEAAVSADDWTVVAPGGTRIASPLAPDGEFGFLFRANGRPQYVQQSLEMSGSAGEGFTFSYNIAAIGISQPRYTAGARVGFVAADGSTLWVTCYNPTGYANRQVTAMSCDIDAPVDYEAIIVQLGWIGVSDGFLGIDDVSLRLR